VIERSIAPRTLWKPSDQPEGPLLTSATAAAR
jgi:hypothetical protein